MSVSAAPSRRGGREARRAIRTQRNIEMLPQLSRGLPYLEPLTEEQLLRIHDASMAILEEVGVDFRGEPSQLGGTLGPLPGAAQHSREGDAG